MVSTSKAFHRFANRTKPRKSNNLEGVYYGKNRTKIKLKNGGWDNTEPKITSKNLRSDPEFNGLSISSVRWFKELSPQMRY